MDADLSHPPESISVLLGALGTADVAIGSHYVAGGGITQWPWSRRLISRAGNAFVRAVLGLPVHDTMRSARNQCGIRRDGGLGVSSFWA
jgi:dolichol-phosphate mannosyltransferase